MGWLILGIGFVLFVEGLAYALAPVRIEDLLEMLRAIPPARRRLIGLVAMGIGLALIWLGRGMILDLCARVTGF